MPKRKSTNAVIYDDTLLLEEYKANVELWKHDDSLRQHRIGNFLTANTILLAALGALITTRSFSSGLGLVFILLSVFGLSISVVWYFVNIRNTEYVRFRRFQLRSIESKLQGLSTFTRMHRAFDKLEHVSFGDIDQVFSISPHARRSSTALENGLPLIIQVFWFLILLGGIVQLFPLLHIH